MAKEQLLGQYSHSLISKSKCSLPLFNEFKVNSMVEKTNKHGSDLWSRRLRLFRSWRMSYFPLYTLTFCFWVHFQQYIRQKHLNSCCFCSSVKVLETIFTRVFLISKYSVKIFVTVSLSRFSFFAMIRLYLDLINCSTSSTFSHLDEFLDAYTFHHLSRFFWTFYAMQTQQNFFTVASAWSALNITKVFFNLTQLTV